MGVEYHVALIGTIFCVRMGCCVVKEVGDLVECFLVGLLCEQAMEPRVTSMEMSKVMAY